MDRRRKMFLARRRGGLILNLKILDPMSEEVLYKRAFRMPQEVEKAYEILEAYS